MVEVPSSKYHKRGSETTPLSMLSHRFQRPDLVLGGPDCLHHAAVKDNVRVNGGHLRCLVDVFQESTSIGHGLLTRIGIPREPVRVDIRVGADSGVAEEVPCAPGHGPGFENDIGVMGERGLYAVCGIDACYTGTNDNDVIVGCGLHTRC